MQILLNPIDRAELTKMQLNEKCTVWTLTTSHPTTFAIGLILFSIIQTERPIITRIIFTAVLKEEN